MAEDLMDKVFSFISGDKADDDKQNMLKQIAKELSQNKYAKFFHVRTEEVDPSFSAFLFSVYKIIYPIKMFMNDEKKMAQLRHLTVASCIDNDIQETIKRLDRSTLDQRAQTVPGEKLISEIQADVEILATQFDINHINTANHRYGLASALSQFVKYNFPGFFKKFDPHFVDGSFIIEPKFPAIKTILIIDQIGDFLTVSQPLRPEEDWSNLLELLKTVEGQEVVNPLQFTAMIKTLREIQTSRILELMVQYTLRNPIWQWKQSSFHETIGDVWLEAQKSEALGYIAKINNAKKNSQISVLLKQIFETTELIRLENYTPHLGEVYRKRNLEFFRFSEGLNYYKVFLDEYVEKEIKELCDILLIRGQWTNNTMSMEMSTALNNLIDQQQDIADLDIVMSEDGADGSRLRAAMLRIDRDPTQARYVNSIVSKNNEEALSIINDAAQSLIVIGKQLKNLIEDLQKKHPELLINWRELNLASKEPIAQRMVGDFKRINYFVQLMHLCTQ